MQKTNLKLLSREGLTGWVLSIGEKAFRASQIWSWMYQKNVSSFSEMTNIARGLQETLTHKAFIYRLRLIQSTGEDPKKTIKFLWELEDGYRIESVSIPEGKRLTHCVSTQVGCAMGCRFCATAKMGFIRNLEIHEITEQVLSMQRIAGQKPTNIVVMGMGEPFLNYENLMTALTILNHPEGAAIGHRKITISTSGIVPVIDRFTREHHPFKLAISLNAVTDSKRSGLMPVNKKYPIGALLQSAKSYARETGKRITFEYILIRGVNDSPEDASELLRLLDGIPCKINLIAYNPTQAGFGRPDKNEIEAFAEIIRPICAPVTLRLSKGDNIDAACGQLATKNSCKTCSHP
jgi:23S rRNA (adenine2503-C2)-methyltransferase